MMNFSLRRSIFFIRYSTVHKRSYKINWLPCPRCQVWIKNQDQASCGGQGNEQGAFHELISGGWRNLPWCAVRTLLLRRYL